MTIRERKKALSSVETTERYLKNRWEKLETEEEIINQPLNEDVSVCDPEMRQYFPRIFVSFKLIYISEFYYLDLLLLHGYASNSNRVPVRLCVLSHLCRSLFQLDARTILMVF